MPINLEETLNQYLSLKQEIFDYFEYKEDWVVIPIDDRREYFWRLTGETHGHKVIYGSIADYVLFETGDQYSDEIYTQRFLPKWVYRGVDYTMVVVDTYTDGNKFLAIYKNELEI